MTDKYPQSVIDAGLQAQGMHIWPDGNIDRRAEAITAICEAMNRAMEDTADEAAFYAFPLDTPERPGG